jgi:FMN phosphatase YigB (HAD superfamily)
LKKLILFVDSGDTFVDEATEVRDENGTVVHSEMFPGAQGLLADWRDAGYSVVLVADGTVASFENIYQEKGLSDCFCKRVISEAVGVCKPNAAMFEEAMRVMNLGESDKKRIVMIGNNLERDIVGANRMGIRSIFIAVSNKRRKYPLCEEEIPTYVVKNHTELRALVEVLEMQLENQDILEIKNT